MSEQSLLSRGRRIATFAISLECALLLVSNFARAELLADPYTEICRDSSTTSELAELRQKVILTSAESTAIEEFNRAHAQGAISGKTLFMELVNQFQSASRAGNLGSSKDFRRSLPGLTGLQSAFDRWLDFAETAERRTYQSVAKIKGLPETSIRPELAAEEFAKVNRLLKAVVTQEADLSASDKENFLRELEGVEPLTVASLRKIPDPSTRIMMAMTFASSCGPSGEAANAFTTTPTDGKEDVRNLLGKTDEMIRHLKPVMVICPGLLANLAGENDVMGSLSAILGHELGHNIAANVEDPPKGFLRPNSSDGQELVRRQFSKTYWGFHACMKDRYQADLVPMPFAVQELRTRAETSQDPDRKKAQLGQAQRLEAAYEALKFELGREPAPLESHAGEIDADLWGFAALGEALQDPGMTPDRARAKIRSSLSFFCHSGTDEGIHPKGKYRIELALRNPKLLAAADWQRPPAETLSRPWCSLKPTEKDPFPKSAGSSYVITVPRGPVRDDSARPAAP